MVAAVRQGLWWAWAKLEAQSQLQGVEVAGMGEQLQIGPEHLRVEELGQKQEMRTQA